MALGFKTLRAYAMFLEVGLRCQRQAYEHRPQAPDGQHTLDRQENDKAQLYGYGSGYTFDISDVAL